MSDKKGKSKELHWTKMKHVPYDVLIKHQPGAWIKRNEIILALCHSRYTADPHQSALFIGTRIMHIANQLIEAIYNG